VLVRKQSTKEYKKMTPLPTNPIVVVLLNPEGRVEAVASNIAPVPELEVVVTTDRDAYAKAALGKSFNTARN
jgi:hypothetical protein